MCVSRSTACQAFALGSTWTFAWWGVMLKCLPDEEGRPFGVVLIPPPHSEKQDFQEPLQRILEPSGEKVNRRQRFFMSSSLHQGTKRNISTCREAFAASDIKSLQALCGDNTCSYISQQRDIILVWLLAQIIEKSWSIGRIWRCAFWHTQPYPFSLVEYLFCRQPQKTV